VPLENDIKHQCISLRVDIGGVIFTPAQQSSYQEGRTRIPLTSLLNHILVPVLGQYLDVQRHMLWSLCSVNYGERWLFVLLILMELLAITIHNRMLLYEELWTGCKWLFRDWRYHSLHVKGNLLQHPIFKILLGVIGCRRKMFKIAHAGYM
jgi:hypothetical protein